MNEGLIATRYARALLQFAEANQQAEVVYAEAGRLSEVYRREKRLRTLLDNPVMRLADKQQMLIAATGGKPSVALRRFIDLMLENGRESFLNFILLKYTDLYRKRNNIHIARLTTVSDIDKATETRIVDLVRQSISGSIELEKATDSNILGGFVLDVDSNRWDASLAGQLRRIRKDFKI
jgi:F-type H+-transporting ATPase subunit delta